jgi:hypothetical protein
MDQPKVDLLDGGDEPQKPHIPWKQLVTKFGEGGLTPAQYVAFGTFPLFLLSQSQNTNAQPSAEYSQSS